MEIVTYMKFDDGFVAVGDLDRKITGFYVPGAIHMESSKHVLLSVIEWDYIDQLWAYLITGLGELLRSGRFETGLPDQPIFINFVDQTDWIVVRVSAEGHFPTREAKIARQIFFTKMTSAAVLFLSQFSKYDLSRSRRMIFSELMINVKSIKAQLYRQGIEI